MTVAGAVLGTPEYMPPEQAAGTALDERADVYALGATLYHLLAGKPPYKGKTSAEVLAQVLTSSPVPLGQRQRGIPPDLVLIVGKAMARDKQDRYPTARELAEDLRRFQTGQLVSAREYSSAELLQRWLKRHRGLVWGLLVLGILAGVSTYSVRRILHERQVALDRSNDLVLVQARTALERDPTPTLAWLKTLPAGAVDEGTVRNLALNAIDRGVARHVFRKDEGRLTFSAASPDGRRLALADARSLLIWDMKDSRMAAHLLFPQEVSRMSFSPDGKFLALTGWESAPLRLWDQSTGVMRELPREDAAGSPRRDPLPELLAGQPAACLGGR